MNIVFHLGAPRTGSTSIQNAMALKFADHESIKVEQIRFKKSALSNHLSYYKYYPNSFLLGHFMAGAGEMFLAVKEEFGEKKLILTEEFFAGDMLGKSNHLFAKMELALTTIQRFSRFHNCTSVVFVRNHVKYIQSCYQFRLQRGETRTISAFIQDLDEERMLWSRILDGVRRFGLLDKFYIVEFDSYFKKHKEFDHAELPLGFNEPLDLKKDNRSANLPELYSFMRQMNKRGGELITRAAELEELMSLEKLEVRSAAEKLFGPQEWIEEALRASEATCQNGIYVDVTMNEEEKELLKSWEKIDAQRFAESDRAFGSFDHWG